MRFLPKNVTVIIRSIGERTEQACYYLLAEQVPKENIVIVNETPFSAALAKSFQVGIERDFPWTLCIDADVLVHDCAVTDLLTIANTVKDNLFQIQADVLCKFFGGPRQAGNRLYRTSMLSKALDCLPKKEVIRPESYTVNQMSSRGYPFLRVKDLIVGLHDYEQYYKDIYRKCFIQFHKHESVASSILAPFWQRLAVQDVDFQVALLGLEAGQKFTEEVTIDSRKFPQNIQDLLVKVNATEKQALSATMFSGYEIRQMINAFEPSFEYQQFQNYLKAIKTQKKQPNLFQLIKHRLQRFSR